MSSASTDYFSQVGSRLSERCGAGALTDEFPHLAAEVLEANPPPRDLDFGNALDWALNRDVLPAQVNFNSGFGQPPLVVYEEERFFAELLVWFPSRTSIHGHGFIGAFVVLAGYSLESQFQFIEREEPVDGLKLGELQARKLELIHPGKVNRILGGDGFIHSVGHMGNPSLTLVIRNANAEATRQYTYFPDGLGVDEFHRRRSLARQAEMLRACAVAVPAEFCERLLAFIRNGDAHRYAVTLKHLSAEIDEANCREELKRRAHDQFGEVATIINDAWRQQERSRKIWTGLKNFTDPRAQLQAALGDLYRDPDELHHVLAKSFPEQTPDQTLTQWNEFVCLNAKD